MSAGRPMKPTALKVVEGNPGKRPLNEAEPETVPASGDPPAWLQENGRKVWEELAPVALEMGVLTKADEELFAHACALLYVGRAVQGQASKELEMANKILARFGFTPSDRAKISVAPKKEDPLGAYLKGRRSG